ncbi:MAG TPA: hypothetical protein VMU65_11800, partial [Candidatus Saccharimonadales bacterium]|nr:hypothetical protein [Candidatus Saccharimonadales bacterium]
MTIAKDQDGQVYVAETTKPHNVDADRAEWVARTAVPLPPNAFVSPPATRQMTGTEYMNAELAERRRAREAEQQHGSLLDAAVERLGVLLEAVADQNAGRELTSRQMAAFGDLARLLDTAKTRRVGLGPAGVYSVAPAE